MAVTRYTLTGDFGDIVGDEFNVKSVKAFLSTNVPAGQALVNLTDNEIQVGAKELTLDTSGAFSVSLIASDSADTNIASGTLQYRVTFSYVNPSTRTRDTWDSGYFALTANSDLSDVAGTIEAPISWRSAFIADMEAIQAAAEAARDAAVDISSISTSDDVVEALVLGTAGAGPKTRAALSASTGEQLETPGTPLRTAADKFYQTQTMNLRREVTPSGTNDTTAVNAALAAFAAAGGGKIVIPRDDWVFTGATGLAVTGTSSPLHLEFEDDTVFDMTGLTALTGLTLGGSATATTAALGADVAKGAETLTCALACVAGDIIQIKSTDVFESLSSQPKGEFAEVLSASGGTITLKGGLYDSYVAATTTVTLMQMPRVTVEGQARFLRNGDTKRMIEIANARDAVLGGVYAEGARERLFYLNHIYGGTIDNIKGRDFWSASPGTNYGLVVAAGQHIKEIGNDLRGGRHAVSHGGLLPSRDIQVIGGTFDNYHASGQKSFDFHGDCEHVRIVGATILNGLNSQASNLYVGAGTRIRSVGAIPAVEIGPARSCDFIKLVGVDIESASGQEGIDYIARNGSNATTLGVLEIDATIRSGGACVGIFPSTSAMTGATIDRVYLRGDWYTASTSAALSTSQASAAGVTINNLDCEAKRWRSDGGNGVSLTGNRAGKATFRGKYSTGKSGGSPLSIFQFTDITFEDFVLEGTNNPLRTTMDPPGVLVMRDGLIDGGSSAGGLNAPNFDEGLISNVRRINTTGTPASTNLPAKTYESIDVYGNVVASATATPVKGLWNQGDFVKNRSVAAAGLPGWDCTTTGGASSAAWAATTAYAVGAWIRTSGSKVLQCTVAGTSSGVEPTPAAVGDTAVDGTVTWVCRATALAVFKARANDAA